MNVLVENFAKLILLLMKFNYKGAYAVFKRDIVSSKLLHTSTFFSNYFIYRRKYIVMSIESFLENGHMLEDFAKTKAVRMKLSIAKKG